MLDCWRRTLCESGRNDDTCTLETRIKTFHDDSTVSLFILLLKHRILSKA